MIKFITFVFLLTACGNPDVIDLRDHDYKGADALPVTGNVFVLDAHGLKQRFEEVFGKDMPRGEAWLNALTKRINHGRYQAEYLPFDRNTFFSPEEEAAFGTYNIWANRTSPASTARLQAKRSVGLTQGYLRSLRAFLADACLEQVIQESAGGRTRILMTDSVRAPTVAEVDAFMSRMFGFPASVTGNAGAKEYQKLLEAGIKQNLDRDKLFVNFCIAVGQDQRTFIR